MGTGDLLVLHDGERAVIRTKRSWEARLQGSLQPRYSFRNEISDIVDASGSATGQTPARLRWV